MMDTNQKVDMLPGQVDSRVYVGSEKVDLLQAIYANVPIIVAGSVHSCCTTEGYSREILGALDRSNVDIYYLAGCSDNKLSPDDKEFFHLRENPYFQGYRGNFHFPNPYLKSLLQNPTMENVLGFITLEDKFYERVVSEARTAFTDYVSNFVGEDVDKRLSFTDEIKEMGELADRFKHIVVTTDSLRRNRDQSASMNQRLGKYI